MHARAVAGSTHLPNFSWAIFSSSSLDAILPLIGGRRGFVGLGGSGKCCSAGPATGYKGLVPTRHVTSPPSKAAGRAGLATPL